MSYFNGRFINTALKKERGGGVEDRKESGSARVWKFNYNCPGSNSTGINGLREMAERGERGKGWVRHGRERQSVFASLCHDEETQSEH